MSGKDFLSILDVNNGDVKSLVEKSARMKGDAELNIMKGKNIALLFEKPSLRTRVSFEVGIKQMGGNCIFLGGAEVGLGVREPESDVAMVLDRLVDCIVARVFSHRSLELLADNCSIPVVNALSDKAHPCQAIGDCLTIFEHKGDLTGLKLAFVGDGNNVAGSLALACSYAGMDFSIASPESHRLPKRIWDSANKISKEKNTCLTWTSAPTEAVNGADIVYTDVWVSMGDEDEREERLATFSEYQVNEKLVLHAKPDFIFMHDMPAHRGEEISEGMLGHPNSVVYKQAENRLHAQKAILAELFGY